jgi:hypothetical protein
MELMAVPSTGTVHIRVLITVWSLQCGWLLHEVFLCCFFAGLTYPDITIFNQKPPQHRQINSNKDKKLQYLVIKPQGILIRIFIVVIRFDMVAMSLVSEHMNAAGP